MFEGWLSAETLIVLLAWLSFTLFMLVVVVPRLSAKVMCEKFGLVRVQVRDRTIYVPEDMEGEPVKIPVGVKEVDGEQQVVWGYAPLPMTLTWMAAEQAAMKVKMTLLNVKSQAAKKLGKEALAAAMGEGGSLEAMFPFLPKKMQGVIALAKALGVGPKGAGSGQGQSPGTVHNDGQK